MAKHIGIVGCSAEGAALCDQTICTEAPHYMGEHDHPEITLHTYPLSEYMSINASIYGELANGVFSND
jgi:aspartate racemase